MNKNLIRVSYFGSSVRTVLELYNKMLYNFSLISFCCLTNNKEQNWCSYPNFIFTIFCKVLSWPYMHVQYTNLKIAKHFLHALKMKVKLNHCVLSRDSAQPDGIRASALSVASTAIAAAQWSSSQVSWIYLCWFLFTSNLNYFHVKYWLKKYSSSITLEWIHMNTNKYLLVQCQ